MVCAYIIGCHIHVCTLCHMYIRTYMCCSHSYIRTYIRICVCTYICTYTCMYVFIAHSYIYIRIYVCTYVFILIVRMVSMIIYIFRHILMYELINIHTYTCTYIRTYLVMAYKYVHVRMYVLSCYISLTSSNVHMYVLHV